MTDTSEFHRNEYAALRSQMTRHVDSMRSLERYVGGAVAAVYSWILLQHHEIGGHGDGHGPYDPAALLWYLPVAIVMFGCLRSIAMERRTNMLAEYTRRIENHYADDRLGGWEHFYMGTRRSSKAFLSRRALWILLVVVSLFVSISSHVYH